MTSNRPRRARTASPAASWCPSPAYLPYPRRIRSYEIALDEDPAPGAELVHGGDGIALPTRPGERRPVIPEHLRTWAGVRGTAARHGGLLAHRGAYHAVRSPGYLLKASGWAVSACSLVLDAGDPVVVGRRAARLRSLAVVAGDSREWRNLHKDAQEQRAGSAAWSCSPPRPPSPWPARCMAALLALVGMGAAGRGARCRCWPGPGARRTSRSSAPATTTPRFRVLNADIVLRAYYAAGLGHPDKPGQQITFGAPMTRDGDGSRVLVDLPYGKGLDDAVKARAAIASGPGRDRVAGVHPPRPDLAPPAHAVGRRP